MKYLLLIVAAFGLGASAVTIPSIVNAQMDIRVRMPPQIRAPTAVRIPAWPATRTAPTNKAWPHAIVDCKSQADHNVGPRWCLSIMALDEIGGERRKAAFFDCGDPAAAVDRLAPSQTAALAEVAAHLEGIQGTQLAGGERKAKRKS